MRVAGSFFGDPVGGMVRTENGNSTLGREAKRPLNHDKKRQMNRRRKEIRLCRCQKKSYGQATSQRLVVGPALRRQTGVFVVIES